MVNSPRMLGNKDVKNHDDLYPRPQPWHTRRPQSIGSKIEQLICDLVVRSIRTEIDRQ
jgi:hypothetical protein